MRIDAYTHFMPDKFFKKLVESGAADIGKRMREIPAIHDLDAPPQDRRQLSGLCADPVLSDAAARGAGQGRRQADRGIYASSSMTALPRFARNIPTSFPAGWRRPRSARRCRRARSRTRDQERRARRADLHQHRRQAARRSGVRAVFRGDEPAQQADLAASGARRQFPGLSDRDRNRNTKSGGRSAGPTRPRRRWRGWCSRRSWTSTRT